MTLAFTTMSHPFREDVDGVIRIGATRVTLETVVAAYDQGSTPDEIALRYPVLDLAQVYTTIAFFLANEADLRKYVLDQGAGSAAARQESDQRPAVAALRERLRARKAG